jgi:hypothetical protein
MKKGLVFLLSLIAFSALLSAQTALSPSAAIPTIDGKIGPDEYQFTTLSSGMTIGATLGDDGKLYLSIRAKTSGWVALGLGNGRMDGARLFLAYDKGDKQAFDEQRGSGHSHNDLSEKVVEKWAVKAEGGDMSLEFVLPASAAVAKGKVGLLYAYSDSTSYASRHKARGAMSLTVN